MLDQLRSASAPRRPSSTRVRALIRLMRVRAVSAMASTAARRSGRTRPPPSAGGAQTASSAGCSLAWAQLVVEALPAAPAPGRSIACRLLRRRRGPCRGRAGRRGRPGAPARRRRCRRGRGRCARPPPGTPPRRPAGRGTSLGLGSPAAGAERVGRPGPAAPPPRRSSSIGKASTSVGPSLPRKRSFRSAIAVLVDEEHRQLAVAPDALGVQDRLGQADQAHGVDRLVRLLVGGEDLHTHRPTARDVARS